MPLDPVERLGERGSIARPVGSARQWQVKRRAFAFAGPGFVRMAPEEGIIGRRVRMDRGKGDVGAIVEDVLSAVAVVIVHVEDRDSSAGSGGMLGRDGRIAEVGITAEIVRAGMMSGRAAQGED